MPSDGDVMEAVVVVRDGVATVTATDWTDEEREERGAELTTFVYREGVWHEVVSDG